MKPNNKSSTIIAGVIASILAIATTYLTAAIKCKSSDSLGSNGYPVLYRDARGFYDSCTHGLPCNNPPPTWCWVIDIPSFFSCETCYDENCDCNLEPGQLTGLFKAGDWSCFNGNQPWPLTECFCPYDEQGDWNPYPVSTCYP